MSDIVGTNVGLCDFLQNKEVKISIQPGTPNAQEIWLQENRKYVIPSFQREIRWKDENVNVLLSDLKHGPIFIGNFILTIKSDNTCEIIDGQQRTTVLILLLCWLKLHYEAELEIPQPCRLENRSFIKLQDIIDIAFDQTTVSDEEWDSFLSTDRYNQFPRISAIWESFNQSSIITNKYSADTVIKNLKDSQVNIIANRADDISNSIRYFLDVNLKGIHLDDEDIFKAYLIKQDSSEEVLTLWESIKDQVTKINSAKTRTKDERYPLMKVLEQYLYCDLLLPSTENGRFQSVSFGDNFCIKKDFSPEPGVLFYEGTHIIEVVKSRTYFITALRRILHALKIMNTIIDADTPTDTIRRLFKSQERIDSTLIYIYHSLLKKIVLDQEVVPKALALKYIINYFDGEEHSKEDYSTLLTIFAASVVFVTFSFKKRKEWSYTFVKASDWIVKLKTWLYDYGVSPELTKGKAYAAYDFDELAEDQDARIRCISLAAVRNYFVLEKHNGIVTLSISDFEGLKAFLHDNEKFSLEHFFIGNSNVLRISTSKYAEYNYQYPASTKKLKNSLFNFIFIPKALNGDDRYGNSPVYDKLSFLREHKDEILCKYSIGYITKLNKSFGEFFPNYPTIESIDSTENKAELKKQLDDYFQKTFLDEFYDFSRWITQSIKWIRKDED